MSNILQHRIFQGPKGFFVAFGIISVLMLLVIAMLTFAPKAFGGCDAACQKQEFIKQHQTAFNAGGFGRTPAGLFDRGSIERKAKAAYNRDLAAAAKAPNPDVRALAAAAPSADAWWNDFIQTAVDGATCALEYNINSCVKTVNGPAADTFVSIWNDTPVGEVVILCSVPTIVAAAGSPPGAEWAGAGFGAGTCLWGWYYGQTH